METNVLLITSQRTMFLIMKKTSPMTNVNYVDGINHPATDTGLSLNLGTQKKMYGYSVLIVTGW